MQRNRGLKVFVSRKKRHPNPNSHSIDTFVIWNSEYVDIFTPSIPKSIFPSLILINSSLPTLAAHAMLGAARSSALRSAPELLTALRFGWAASLHTSTDAASSPAAVSAATVAAEVSDPSHAARLQAALDLPVTQSPSPWSASPSELESSREIFRLHNSSLKVSGGHMIKARVLNVDRKRIMLDTGVKVAKIAVSDITPECILERAADGGVPRGPGEVRPGDVVQVYLEHEETPEGDMLVSGQQAAVRRRVRAVWRELQDRLRDGQPVKGRVLNSLSGGYAVGVAGLVCFLPNSATTRATARRIGQLQDFKVTGMNAARNNVVLADWRFVRGGRPIFDQQRQQQQRGGGGQWRQQQQQNRGNWKSKSAVAEEAEQLKRELEKKEAAAAAAPSPA